MAHVADHLSIEELEQRYRACEDACSARHYQTIWLLAQGHTIAAVSALTSFVPRWIEELLARHNALGPRGPGPLGPKAGVFETAEGSARATAAGWRRVDEPKGCGLHGRSAWA